MEIDKAGPVLQATVREFVESWVSAGQFTLPDEVDCLDYIVREASEAIEERLRLNKSYVRNNPRDAAGWAAVDTEVADTMFMCFLWFIIRQQPAHEILIAKLTKMNKKRINNNGNDR